MLDFQKQLATLYLRITKYLHTTMRIHTKKKRRTQKREGAFFIVAKSILIASMVLTVFGLLEQGVVYAQDIPPQTNQSVVSRFFGSIGHALNSAINWVEDQGSKVARAVSGEDKQQSTNTVARDSAEPIDTTEPEPVVEEVTPSQTIPVTQPASAYAGVVVARSASEITAEPRAEEVVTLTVQNTGDATWEHQTVSLNVVSNSFPHPLAHEDWSTQRRPATVIGTIDSGNSYQFTVPLAIPETVGTYEIALRPVVFAEGVFNWIGGTDTIVRWLVRVLENEPEPTPEEVLEPVEETPEEVVEEIPEVEEVIETPEEIVEEPAPSNNFGGIPAALLSFQGDTVAPITSVNGLSSTTNSTTFSVGWTGSDDFGVSSYDIQYQVDSGDWTDWLTQTVLLTSTFTANTDGTYGFRSRGRDAVNNVEAYPSTADTSTVVATTADHSVVINEIAWAGTAANTDDEWIELYNTTSAPIDLTGWTLTNSTGTFSITLSGTIATSSYFMLERDDDNAVSNVTADQIYTGQELTDTSNLLYLRKTDNSFADKVGSATGSWYAGNTGSRDTMERKDPTSDGTASSNWADNDATFVNGQDSAAAALNATAGSLNSANTTIPRTITSLQPQWVYVTSTSTRLYWTAPANANLSTTTPATYDVRYTFDNVNAASSGIATCSLTDANWDSATQLTGEPTPSSTEGAVTTFNFTNLTADRRYCFGVKTNNGTNDSEDISNIYQVDTKTGNYTQLNGYPGSGVIASSSSPYLVTATMTATGGTPNLTIEPGTVIKFAGNYSLTTTQTNSTFTIGDASDDINQVVITSVNDDAYGDKVVSQFTYTSNSSPSAGDWQSIQISTSTGTLNMNNTRVRYGGNSSHIVTGISGAQISISNSILEYSNTFAVVVSNNATQLTIASSTISSNFDGIGIVDQANFSIWGSTITNNRRGISIAKDADPANISITNNNIYANNRSGGSEPTAGLEYKDTDGVDILNSTHISGNWWGAATGPTQDTHNTGDDVDGILDDTPNGTLTTITWPLTNFATAIKSILPSNW